jgi:hypothetical protein
MTRQLERSRPRARTVLGLTTISTAAGLLAACGGTTGPTGLASLPTLPGALSATPSATPGPTSGNLGDTLVMEDSGDDFAHVTLLKVFDPATGFDADTTPPDGTRWVGFEGTIVINGSRSGQDATSVEVIGSDGQTYGSNTSYELTTFDGCTNTPFSDQFPTGATQTFCWAVGLPPGVTVSKIGYSTEGVNGGSAAALFWTVAASSAPTPTPTPTDTPTATPSETPTDTPSATPTASPSPSATATPATQ